MLTCARQLPLTMTTCWYLPGIFAFVTAWSAWFYQRFWTSTTTATQLYPNSELWFNLFRFSDLTYLLIFPSDCFSPCCTNSPCNMINCCFQANCYWHESIENRSHQSVMNERFHCRSSVTCTCVAIPSSRIDSVDELVHKQLRWGSDSLVNHLNVACWHANLY